MGVNLNFGISGFVAVKDMNDRELYRLPVQSEQEADQWIETHKSSVQGWGILKSSFAPVRVDNWEDLAKDLFLPTLLNHALKINSLILKVLASIVAIAWDVLTFPCRLIALPIRLCQLSASNSKPRLPIEELIKASPYFEEARKNGVVRLVAHVEDTHATHKAGEKMPDNPNIAAKKTHDVSLEVWLKDLPADQDNHENVSNNTQMYFKNSPTGEWEK